MISMSRTGLTSPSTWVMSALSKALSIMKMASTARMCDKKALPRPAPSAAPCEETRREKKKKKREKKQNQRRTKQINDSFQTGKENGKGRREQKQHIQRATRREGNKKGSKRSARDRNGLETKRNKDVAKQKRTKMKQTSLEKTPRTPPRTPDETRKSDDKAMGIVWRRVSSSSSTTKSRSSGTLRTTHNVERRSDSHEPNRVCVESC